MKTFILFLIVITLVFSVSANAQWLSITDIEGTYGEGVSGDYVEPNVPITWTFSLNASFHELESFAIGFHLFISTDGTVDGMVESGFNLTPPTFNVLFNFADSGFEFSTIQYGVDGTGADTIGFIGINPGESIHFNEPVWTITTQVSNAFKDYYLCLDTCRLPDQPDSIQGNFTLSIARKAWIIGNNPAAIEGISISNLDGSWDNNTKVTTGRPVTWSIYGNSLFKRVGALTNGFKVYISDQSDGSNILDPGPGFTPITYQTLYGFKCVTYAEQQFGVDGFGADTVGFGGVDCCGFKSLCEPINEVAWTISTQVDNSAEGYYLCLDSTFFPPGGAWLWSTLEAGTIIPPWDGPHCYLIEECCQGMRGDIVGDEGIFIDDLMFLRDFLFTGGPAPNCLKKGDVNLDNQILVNDLVFLVNYLFKGGDAPPLCN